MSEEYGILRTSRFRHFQLRQIAQALQIKGRQERLRRHESMRRPGPRRTGPAGDQVLVAQPGEKVAADLLTKDVRQARPVDRSTGW